MVGVIIDLVFFTNIVVRIAMYIILFINAVATIFVVGIAIFVPFVWQVLACWPFLSSSLTLLS